MACPAEEVLTNLVSGSLPGTERDSVLAHLDSCDSCRVVVAALASSSPALDTTMPGSGEKPAVAEEIAPGTALGRYVVGERLGAGGMGVVYAAFDPVLDRKIALKLLRLDWAEGRAADEARARLLREGQVMARLSHPNVCTVLDVGSWRGRDFIAMELIDGSTLGQWLRETPRRFGEILTVLLDAGRGLAAAHAAGLVHRDFKPDNVLVSRAGRVVVTDFGLARVEAAAEQPAAAVDGAVVAQTRSGAVLGTPAYMAPEQLEGGVADARSDQFSFAVTCFEALAGERPFRAATVIELLSAMRAGQVVAGKRAMPAAARRLLVRALDADPARRPPSIEALLTALARLRHRRRRQLIIAGAALAAVAAAGGVQLARRPSCTGAEARWRGVWDEGAKRSLHQAFAATGVAFAEDAFGGAARALDRYRDAWVAMHTDSCQATRVRGEQPEELLGLRTQCLDDRLAAARALTSELAHADAKLVERATTATAGLPPLDGCADVKALRARVPPPSDRATRDKVSALGERRAQVEALLAAGKAKEALALAKPLADEAKALGYRPLEAEALGSLGDAEKDAGDYKGADTTFHSAVLAAEAGGHLEAGVRGWVQLLSLEGTRLHRFPDAHAAADHARALLERLGGAPSAEASLDENLGMTLLEEGKLDEAQAALERARGIRERLTPDGQQLAVTLNALAQVARKKGDQTGALANAERAVGIFEKVLGPSHPRVAQAIKNVGNTYFNRGQLDEALARYQRALAIQERALGPDHPHTISTRTNVAAVYTQQGKLDEAIATYRRVIASYEKQLGPDTAELLAPLNNLAVALQAKAQLGDAEAAGRRALAIAEKTFGAEHAEVETALVNLGDILLSKKAFDEAAASYRRAIAISEKVVGPDHPHTAEDLGGLGFVLLAEGRAAEAREPLERSVRIGDKSEMDPVNLAKIRFALGRALWETGADKRRAVELARTARGVLVGSGGRQTPDVQEIDAWLKTRAR